MGEGRVEMLVLWEVRGGEGGEGDLVFVEDRYSAVSGRWMKGVGEFCEVLLS